MPGMCAMIGFPDKLGVQAQACSPDAAPLIPAWVGEFMGVMYIKAVKVPTEIGIACTPHLVNCGFRVQTSYRQQKTSLSI